ncbi:MAG: spermidine/putrescine ABC transporter substrate-binding protein, partial [Candidatus Gallimonas sp.]
MKLKRIFSVGASVFLLLPSLSALAGCGAQETVRLRIYNWEEYIDEGGEGSYVYDELGEENAPSLIEDFESWYEETYGAPVSVEYSTFGTNEDLYNQLKLGDAYDLVCPSDYMIMKLAAEDMLEPFTDDFFDESDDNNYYAANVSDYISNVFDNNYVTVTAEDGSQSQRAWSEYAAGYMWGTTGLIYHPDYVEEDQLNGWKIMLDQAFKNTVTTKDNVRDSYFVALAILYEDELIELGKSHEQNELSDSEYNEKITEIMNRTDEETVSAVEKILLDLKSNIYGFETDTGKSDLVTGKIRLNFAWSGDAVYVMDLAEDPDGNEEPVCFNYYIPEECANLWFDGWV